MHPSDTMEMHEALITRGAVMKSEDNDIIMSRYNCVLLCKPCHSSIQGSGGVRVVRLCAEHIVSHEGYDKTLAWLKEMAEEFPTVGDQALTLFKSFQLGAFYG